MVVSINKLHPQRAGTFEHRLQGPIEVEAHDLVGATDKCTTNEHRRHSLATP